ncbi:MAG TPA: ATP-binding protein [Candidatus Coprosoma intestinipullorum]|uniref:ATP-binding protein n=1 Tax=Candidatus Coprosoma intestinipullorum TaxID=2840752 RepID=A0A9D0ZSX5_9FIRM|nr:ATP-binding protein [Candidatus Coprosoma intestinipullorum]
MEKYINRNIESVIEKMSKGFPVIMVTGPRQVGKTTMLMHINKNINYVSLDNLNARDLAISDPELFLETYKAPLVIDEFQYAPNLLSYIKMRVDEARLNNVLSSGKEVTTMYYLTGSQSFLSMKNVSESLAGRVGIIEMYGLSTNELNEKPDKVFIPEITELKKKNISSKCDSKKLFERIFKGSYPELYTNKSITLDEYYESYVKTYIERDIRDLINISDEIKFMKFMTSIAARTGEELNITTVANDAEISVPTAQAWLSILVNTGLVILLEPFSNNVIKRTIKRPKIYFMDTGLACFLAKYPNAEILEASAYAGHIFETYVVSEIIKTFANNGKNFKRYLFYYRDDKKREIDLIIDYNNKLYPIEVKKGKKPNGECTKNFEVLDSLNNEKGKGIVLCMSDEIFPIDRNNYYVPVSYI